jgi:hypothetical protein
MAPSGQQTGANAAQAGAANSEGQRVVFENDEETRIFLEHKIVDYQ